MRTKRLLSIVLTLVMLLGMLPGMSLTVSVADTTTTIVSPATTGTMTITLTIAAASVKTAPEANTLTYSGSAQTLTTTGEAGVGTLQYQLGESATTEPTGTWGTTVPQGTEAKDYYVWYRSRVNDNNISTAGCKTVTIAKASITNATVTLSDTSFVYTGSEQSVTVSSVKLGDTTLTADTDYEVTSGTTGTAKNTYTITVTGKGNYKDTATAQWSIGLATPTIETIPTASAITYGQKLADSTLTGGVAKLGDTTVAGTFAWKNTETKPAVSDSNATEYDVVFTPTDADNYAAVECKVKLTVNKGEGGGTPSAITLVYNGTAQELVTAGVAEGGTMMYAIGNETEATQPYTTTIPTATDAGTYYVWYMVKGDPNHKDTDPACVEATIAKKGLTVTADAKSKTQGEADPALTYTAEGLVGSDTLTGALSREAGEDPGTYAITQGTLTAGDNYEIAFTSAVLTINKKNEPAPVPSGGGGSGGGGGYYGGGTVQNQRRDAYSDVIGAAATNFRDSSPERIRNIELACEKLDGIVLQPGEVFSFNEAVGGLTAEDGFAVAPVNPDDEATAEMGGGVSQVASALYSSSLFALLETVERTNHPFTVPFIQPGTDAYVTDSGDADALDLKLRNTRGEPIRISAKTRADEARQVREIVIELRSALGSSDYMPIRFDNTWGGDQNAFLTETPYDLTRPGYRILLTHEEQAFTDDHGAGIRTLTHRKILDAAGMLVRDEILNSKLPDGSYAMDTYYQG